jgi:serine/threonine-protein kinase
MSEVVAATDLRLGRVVAVKLLSTELDDPVSRARFEGEARALSSFVHPNAVAVFDVGVDGEQPYLVMELVEGPTLASTLAQRGPLRVDEAVGIADQILAAVDAAHGQGIVHRDVKPSNILLGSDGRVRLADFGIAKSIDGLTEDLTATGQVVGTASYLAPEVARGERASPASDLYAVGIVLFEMLAGDVPLRRDTPLATLAARERSVPPSLRSLRPDVPVALDMAVAQSLSRDPTRRFGTAREMQAAIAATDTSQTIPFAAEPTSTYPLAGRARASRRPPRRGRRLARVIAPAAALGVAVATIVGITASGIGTDTSNPPNATRPTDATTTASPTSTVPRATAPTTTNLPTPATLAELVALLATPDNRYGAQQQALRERLLHLIDAKPGHEAKNTSALTRDVSRWASTGQLDSTIANDTIALLAGVPQAPGKHGKERD